MRRHHSLLQRMFHVVVASLVALSVSGADAADYPARAVKLIVQGAAGSGPDVVARTVADGLGRLWNQPVVIVNQPGAGGVVAARTAAAADADGYTLYLPTITTFVIMPELHESLPFDLDRDFVRIGMLAETPMMIGVSPSLGVGSLQELIAAAKRRPGELFYAANNRGSLPHLAGELFRRHAGIDIGFVPYPGAAAGLQDVAGGRVAMIVESVGALTGAMQGGTIKPLAVASAQRLSHLPDLPAVAETLPGFAAMGWFALMAPKGIAPALVRKLNQDLNVVLVQADVQRRLQELGAFARPMSPEATADFIRAEQKAWRPLVREVGLKAQ